MRRTGVLALVVALSACGSDAAERVVSPADVYLEDVYLEESDEGATDTESPAPQTSAHEPRKVAKARRASNLFGTAQTRAEAPRKRRRLTAAEREMAARVARATDSTLPGACAEGEPDCLPPEHWVDRLCSGVHPELALHMFRGGSPWKRLYSRKIAPAFNGAGGPSISDERIQRGEELIALRRNTDAKRSNAGEMSIGYTAGYDLLRWNGSCVTLHDGEFTTKPPRRRLTHARVEWRALGDRLQETLRGDELISRAYLERRKECRGISLGNVTRKCVQQDQSLVMAIVNYVRGGGELPAPTENL